MSFPCNKCGACCRMAWVSTELQSWGWVLPDGSCKHLLPDNTCDIYETRPEACRIDARKPHWVPEEVYHKVQKIVCNYLMDRLGAPDERFLDSHGEAL